MVMMIRPSVGKMDCTGDVRQNWLEVFILDWGKLAEIYGGSGWEMKMACFGFNLVPVVIWCKRILELL